MLKKIFNKTIVNFNYLEDCLCFFKLKQNRTHHNYSQGISSPQLFGLSYILPSYQINVTVFDINSLLAQRPPFPPLSQPDRSKCILGEKKHVFCIDLH